MKRAAVAAPVIASRALPLVTSASGLKRWTQAVKLAGLEPALDSASSHGRFSLLVPDDRAFEAFELELRQAGSSFDRWSSDRKALQRLLLGHVLPAAWSATEIRSAGPRLGTLGGQALRVRPGAQQAGELILCDGSGGEARVLSSRQTGPQRHLHVIDRVLQPARLSLVDLMAQAPEHHDFLAALCACGLDALLAGDGPITVLAPGSAGMARLAPRLGLRWRELERDPQLLRRVLSFHLLPGAWSLSDMPWGGQLQTVCGETLRLSALGLLGDGESRQALRPQSERQARNGLLHGIDQPLLPPSLSLTTLH